MNIFGVQLQRPTFGMITRATAVAVLIWSILIYGTRQFGLPVEPIAALASLLIGALVFITGIDVLKDLRHMAVGIGLYVALNSAVEVLVLPLV